MKKILTTVLLFTLVLSGCGSKSNSTQSTNSQTIDSLTTLPPIQNEQNPIATIDVDGYGAMKFELFPDVDQSTKNFIELANNGFYNGLTFHRLIPDFVIQGGDPQGTGMGGPGYSIKGEFKNNGVENNHKHQIGSLAFARSTQPNSAGSQFYIVTGSNVENLDGQYAVFGQMIEGLDVLKQLNQAPTEGELPVPTIKINSISIDTKGVDYGTVEKLPNV